MRALLSAMVCALGLAVVGCSGDVGGDGTILGGPMCQPGQVQACTCQDGTISNRTCLEGGRASACMCADDATAAPGTGQPGAVDPGVSDPVGGGETVDPGVMDPVEDPGVMDPAEDPVEEPGPTEPISSVDVPAGTYCQAVADWNPQWVQFEDEVLLLTNEVRARGANCDSEGNFGPTGALTMNAELRCAARLHSQDMGQNDYFAHNSQDGTDPFQRMQAAGYSGGAMGENIAAGQTSPQEVVDGWVDSDGHCANIMQPSFTELGVGYYEEEGDGGGGFGGFGGFGGARMWTQNFGAPGGGFGWP